MPLAKPMLVLLPRLRGGMGLHRDGGCCAFSLHPEPAPVNLFSYVSAPPEPPSLCPSPG